MFLAGSMLRLSISLTYGSQKCKVAISGWYELKNKVGLFLAESKSDLADWHNGEDWPCHLDYVADIFYIWNELNPQLPDFGGKKIPHV